MGKCTLCGRVSSVISDAIGYCVDCLRSMSTIPERVLLIHKKAREMLKIPLTKYRSGRFRCGICVNNCYLDRDVLGSCGNYTYDKGFKSTLSSFEAAYGSWYYDPHPTNCVAFPVCPAITGRGYPKYVLRPNGEVGYYNLAVFYGTCSLNCLYCQNWRSRVEALSNKQSITIDELVNAALNDRVTCICYFGGDPTPNIIHALRVSREVLSMFSNGRVLRICWETNGTLNSEIMREVARISLESGGIVKIDLKAWSPMVYQALTGVNAVERVRENIKLLSSMAHLRDEPPLLVVSVLLVPGYVDLVEVRGIAGFLASINTEIPVVLLAFHPEFLLRDLPPTSKKHMYESVKVMRELGLKNVFVGNEWLLGDYY